MTVTINEIKENTCELYDPDSNWVGTIRSALSFNDVRLQISRRNLIGYYVMFGNEQIAIDKDGKADKWPRGFFDIWENQLFELL